MVGVTDVAACLRYQLPARFINGSTSGDDNGDDAVHPWPEAGMASLVDFQSDMGVAL